MSPPPTRASPAGRRSPWILGCSVAVAIAGLTVAVSSLVFRETIRTRSEQLSSTAEFVVTALQNNLDAIEREALAIAGAASAADGLTSEGFRTFVDIALAAPGVMGRGLIATAIAPNGDVEYVFDVWEPARSGLDWEGHRLPTARTLRFDLADVVEQQRPKASGFMSLNLGTQVVLVVAPTTGGTSDVIAAGVLIDVEALRVGAMSDVLADVISIEVHGATPTPGRDFVATRPIEIGESRYEVQVKPVPGSPIARPGSGWWAITAAIAALAGVLIGALTSVVLERRRVRSDLAKARERDAARLEFLASVSHELRTPITAMTGFMQLLSDDWDSLPDDERRDLVVLAGQQGQEVAAMIADLLVLTRDNASTINLAPQQVDLPILVDRVVNGVPSEYRDRVAAEVPALELRTDPTRLAQVLRNLLVNGLIHGAGPVRLTAGLTDSELVIRVTDDGPGVPPEFVEAMFEPFVSVPGASQSLPSNGVGLYVSRRIVEQMGGTLRYLRESDTTVFEVTLPMASNASAAVPVAG